MSRTLILFLALLLAPAAWSKQVVLRIPDYPADADAGPGASANREAIRLFEAKYPNIKIDRLQGISQLGNFTEAPELMAIAGGTAPDVLAVTVRKIQNYI